jgi:hypothetical protein
MKEIETISNDNLLLRATITDLDKKYDKLLKGFNELLDVHLEMRERFGFGEFTQDYKYDWIDRAGLIDNL